MAKREWKKRIRILKSFSKLDVAILLEMTFQGGVLTFLERLKKIKQYTNSNSTRKVSDGNTKVFNKW